MWSIGFIFGYFFAMVLYAVQSDEFWGPTPLEFIEKYHFKGEKHQIVTEDGYILTLHRIQNRKSFGTTNPVLFVHALASHSGHFLYAPYNLPYFLVNLENSRFDVWLLDTRGSIWARNHTKYCPDRDQKEYWNFSYDEIGTFDNTAAIDHILKMTGQKKLVFIALSQGGTTFFTMVTNRPEYNRKIHVAILFAPPVQFDYGNGLFEGILKKIVLGIKKYFEHLPMDKIKFKPDVRMKIAKFCELKRNYQFCTGIIESLGQIQKDHVDPVLPNTFFWTFPPPISKRDVLHFLQNIVSGTFARYDFGPVENLRRYGTGKPPLYDLRRVLAPVVLYYGPQDQLVTNKTISSLISKIPNHARSHIVSRPTFSHCDYVLAKDTPELIYQSVFRDLKEFLKL